MIIEDDDSDEELIEKKILEYTQDPRMKKIMEKVLGSNPNTYFLKLAQYGAKLPMEFNVETLKDQPLIHMGDKIVVRQIPKPSIDPKIPSIFSNSKVPMNEKSFGKHVDNPLYRHPSQVEQAIDSQHSQVDPNVMAAQNIKHQSKNPFSTPLFTHNVSTNTWRPSASRNLYGTSLSNNPPQHGPSVNIQNMGNIPPRAPH